jgi:hypothetical protein
MSDIHHRHFADAEIINCAKYNYFNYKEKKSFNLIDRVMHFSTKPLYTTSMGGPQFVYNVTGLNLFDLLQLDVKTYEKLEAELLEFGEMMKPKPSDMPPADKKD